MDPALVAGEGQWWRLSPRSPSPFTFQLLRGYQLIHWQVPGLRARVHLLVETLFLVHLSELAQLGVGGQIFAQSISLIGYTYQLTTHPSQ